MAIISEHSTDTSSLVNLAMWENVNWPQTLGLGTAAVSWDPDRMPGTRQFYDAGFHYTIVLPIQVLTTAGPA